MNIFITYLWKDPQLFFAISIIVIFSVCCHEFVHAATAMMLGDDTAANRGHLTFNPFKQMGIISLVMLCLFGLAWGQVPVNPANFRKKYFASIVAASGPLTNLVLSQLFILLCFAVAYMKIDNRFAILMLLYGGALNIMLAIINLLPFPGMDGWAILQNCFPKLLAGNSEVVKGTYFVLIVLFFVSFNKVFSLCFGIAQIEISLLARLLQ